MVTGNVVKINKTHFCYVLYSDKTWVFDQSEHTQGPIYILIANNITSIYVVKIATAIQ